MNHFLKTVSIAKTVYILSFLIARIKGTQFCCIKLTKAYT